jgi:hypothetical protein
MFIVVLRISLTAPGEQSGINSRRELVRRGRVIDGYTVLASRDLRSRQQTWLIGFTITTALAVLDNTGQEVTGQGT